MSRPWLSVAIATMKRWEFLKDTLPILLERPEVGEVIVCDETGEDVSEISQSPFAQDPKLRLVINEKRLGIYENKCKAMRLATLPWVAVLDSDNIFPDSFFDLLEEKLDRSNPFCLVGSAEFLRIDQRTGATTTPTQCFSGQLVDATLWNRYMSDPQAFAKGWIHLANDGNWIVSQEAIQALRLDIKSSDVYAADAIFMLHHWLSQGFQILYLEGLQYMHIVHNGSSWLQMESASMDVLNRMNWAISKN
jgi:glycosyltransferase involved in cell wall biosynthesis